MVHIDRCPRCGRPGFAYVKLVRCGKENCRCARGRLHGPYLVVKHYTGYDRVRDQGITRTCHIGRRKELTLGERRRIAMLLKKYEGGRRLPMSSGFGKGHLGEGPQE